ncbi:ATP-binding protein [Spirosoma fluminis]
MLPSFEDSTIYEDGTPFPEYLIKSISEQGYSLETSLADLIDNSISAGADKIEILVDTENLPFTLFLADNGNGMDEECLRKSMRFPSSSLELQRDTVDLGRFGLGMKTASFAQTRKFTVISRPKSEEGYTARTWDVEHLKIIKEWQILINQEEDIQQLMERYQSLSTGFFNGFDDFRAGTVIIWQGLYKFENFLEGRSRSDALSHQLTEVTHDYLSLVFHRFMERAEYPLQIRINNVRLKPFSPFPEKETGFRPVEPKYKAFKTDVIRLDGFILPVRSIEESKERVNVWTPPSRGLMDMEGLYIYRSGRIILFGGWNGIIRKSPKLQLARLRVEVGNRVDNLLQLNVAKSQIAIPFDLKTGFLKYIIELKTEAEKEYFNRDIRKISSRRSEKDQQLFERSITNKGSLLEINSEFPLISIIKEKMDSDSVKAFNLLIRMINTGINKLRHTHEDKSFQVTKENDSIEDDLESTIVNLIQKGIQKQTIKNTILPALGYRVDTIPHKITQLLN